MAGTRQRHLAVRHHHHSLISGYAYVHNHPLSHHTENGHHTDDRDFDPKYFLGSYPDPEDFGKAHTDHAPFPLTFNQPMGVVRKRHPRYKWSL